MDIADIRKRGKGKDKSQEGENDVHPKDEHIIDEVEPSSAIEKVSSEEDAIIIESPQSKQTALAPTEEFYKRHLADKDREDDLLQFLSFRVYNEEYALPLSDIKEVVKMREITEVPYAPPFIPGIISLRGEIIPTMNLHNRLGLKNETMLCLDQDTRVVIAAQNDAKLGFIVDKILGVVRVSPQDIESTPAIQQSAGIEFIKGVIHHSGRLVMVLNLTTLFLFEEGMTP